MKTLKKVLALVLSLMLIALTFTACSSKDSDEITNKTLIIGYTEAAAPFIEENNGEVTGFIPDLFDMIFKNIRGDEDKFIFKQIPENYTLEEGGLFTDNNGAKVSAALLVGKVAKDEGTFNSSYSYSDPIITDRVITVTLKDSKYNSYSQLTGAKAVVVGEYANSSLEENSSIKKQFSKVTEAKDIDSAIKLLESKKVDAIVCDEFAYMPKESKSFTILEGELDITEYVIATKKGSGWPWSINEAIYEKQSPEYEGKDEFTPLVEKYFGYDASSFSYVPSNN